MTIKCPDELKNVDTDFWECGSLEQARETTRKYRAQTRPFLDVLLIWGHACDDNGIMLKSWNFARDAEEADKIEKLGRNLGVDEAIRARFEDGVPAADLLF